MKKYLLTNTDNVAEGVIRELIFILQKKSWTFAERPHRILLLPINFKYFPR